MHRYPPYRLLSLVSLPFFDTFCDLGVPFPPLFWGCFGQTADRANGNNGEIGLPYFDWSALATTGGGGSVELKQADSTAEVDLLPKWFTEASITCRFEFVPGLVASVLSLWEVGGWF